MIGDNPAADLIPGALWHPILVRTGVFQGTSHERAKAVCNNVEEAVRFVLEREKII
jgi:ribonucleotide monophosphatase NagD (HAD superfamily)